MTNEKQTEEKDAFYYLGKAAARIDPFLMGNPARTLEEMQEVVDEYVRNGGYTQHPRVYVMGQETDGPDLIDVALATHTIRLITWDRKLSLDEAVNQFRERYSGSSRLLGAIESARGILDEEQRKNSGGSR